MDVGGITQAGGVARGPLAAQGVPFVEVLQLGAEHSGLQVVQAAVVAHAVAGSLIGPVVAQLADFAVHILVVGNHRAAIAKTAEVLLGDEAGADGVAQFADSEAVSASADPLRIVFHDQQIVAVGDLAEGLHVGGLAIEMNRDQGLGAGRDGGFHLRRIEAIGARVGVDKYSGCAGDPDGLGGGEEGVGGGDALIAGANPEGQERKPERVGSVGDADGELHSVIFGQLLLEPQEHGTHDILAGFQNSVNVPVNLRFKVVILADMAVESDVHTLMMSRRSVWLQPVA
jgi:hypothetical protein